jgi:sec-independent protein translocase protein TatB
MFGIDFSEIVVIFVIALVVLGPEKLPKLAQTVGKWIGRARSMARQFREQLEQEADQIQRAADLKAHMKAPSRPAPTPTATANPTPAHATSPDADIASAHLTPETPAVPESHERGQ